MAVKKKKLSLSYSKNLVNKLQQHTDVQELDLDLSQCNDYEGVFSAVASLVKLEKLSLKGSRSTVVSLPSAMSSLINLHTLNFYHVGRIKNISVLTGLRNLTVKLSDEQNFSDLAECTQLQHLTLSYCFNMDNVSALTNFKNLKTLKVYNCGLKDISALVNCNNIELLDFTGCPNIEDISALANLTKLHTLVFDRCDMVDDILSVAKCTNLQKLVFNNCKNLDDISPLSNLKQLKSFDCCDCINISNADVSSLKKKMGI